MFSADRSPMGLAYPIIVAVVTVIIGAAFIREKRGVRIDAV